MPLILAMDRGEVTSLILFDLSAAFDTVDHSILLILVLKIGSVLMVCLLIGSHLISHFALRQSQSMIPSLHSLLFPVVYPEVPYSAHSFSLSIQLLLARWSQKNSLKYHLYADDTQLCISFTPTNSVLISWNTYHHFQWHSLQDGLEQTASQSINNWMSSHWHKTTTSQIFWSNKLISQQWYHPSQFLCSQSWLHLWLWHVFLWSNQLFIQILSFSYPRHPSNSSSSSFYSHCSCKFPCLQQTWLLQFTLLWHLTNKSQQNSTHSEFIWHVSLQIH